MTFAADSLRRTYLLDECQISRPAERAAGALDRSTMVVASTVGEEIYRGRCLIEPAAADRQGAAGGQMVVIERATLMLPADAEGPRVGDVVRPRETRDPALEDRVWRIVRVLSATVDLLREYELEASTPRPATGGA